MGKFIVRRFFLLLLTMLLVSMAMLLITQSSPSNVARNVLGAFVTPEQEASFLAQLGLTKPLYGARVFLVILPISEHYWLPGRTAFWGVFVALLVGTTLSLMS